MHDTRVVKPKRRGRGAPGRRRACALARGGSARAACAAALPRWRARRPPGRAGTAPTAAASGSPSRPARPGRFGKERATHRRPPCALGALSARCRPAPQRTNARLQPRQAREGPAVKDGPVHREPRNQQRSVTPLEAPGRAAVALRRLFRRQPLDQLELRAEDERRVRHRGTLACAHAAALSAARRGARAQGCGVRALRCAATRAAARRREERCSVLNGTTHAARFLWKRSAFCVLCSVF